MHTVALLALDGVVAFDLATPVETLGRARSAEGEPLYRLLTVSHRRQVDAGPFSVRATHGLDALAEADTVIVPGVQDFTGPYPQVVLEALREAAASGTRVASICVGTFVLAAAGLLEGRRVTTHWAAADELARRYPAVDVDPTVLYAEDSGTFTSAGGAAGLDLCLHLVFRDHGSAVAAEVSRQCVMPLERAGGQAQFIAHEPTPPDGTSLAPLLEWLEENCAQDVDLAAIAARAGTSVRTLSRHFAEQVGTTPVAWLNRVRLRQAQSLLETTDHTVDSICAQVGFGSVVTFRERFRTLVGTSPREYRRAFRAGGTRAQTSR